MKLNKLNFNSIRIGQYVYNEEHGLTGRVVRGEIGYNRNDSDMLTIEWFHADGTIGVVSCPHQHCDYTLIEDQQSILCDHCDKKITDFENDLVHVAGIIDGEFNNHIHLCKSCFGRLKVPEINLDALRKAANFYTTRRPKTV